MQQNPEPDRPRWAIPFTVTPGAPVLPLPPAEQAQTTVRRLPPPGALAATPAFSGIEEQAVVRGEGFEPGKTYALNWNRVVGHRMTGAGWQEGSSVIAQAAADRAARAEFASWRADISAAPITQGGYRQRREEDRHLLTGNGAADG